MTFQRRAPSEEVGDVGLVLKQPFRYAAQPIRQGWYGNSAATILEQRGPADTEWLATVGSGQVTQPYARDLKIQEAGRRLIFEQSSHRLLHASEFVTLVGGGEQVVRSQEWNLVEVLGPAQVPPLTLTPIQPALRNQFSSVPTRQLTVRDASESLPFALYVLPPASGDIHTFPLTYTLGQRLAPNSVPIQYRGLDFAVQRGDGARMVYDRSGRYLDVVQGASGDFAASLSQARAFWVEAQAISVAVEGEEIAGWILVGPPNTMVDPKTGQSQQVPGPRRLLLPDINGTAVLLTSQGYSDAELLTIAAKLRRIE